MLSAHLPPEKRAEIADLVRAIREAADVEIRKLAAHLATTDDAHLFGQNEFTIRAHPQDRRQGGRAAPAAKKEKSKGGRGENETG